MDEIKLEILELNREDASINLPENKPFFIQGLAGKNQVGLLLVHGFTGSPWEMRDIGLHLAQSGARVFGVRLPGHGTTAEDLAKRSYEEWLDAVNAGYQFLAEECDQIVGVGLSTGALLLLAATEKRSFDGLVLLSPYLKMRQSLAPLAFILRYVVKHSRRELDTGVSPYYYQDRPLAAVHQINRLIRKIKRMLPTIKTPTLVASAAGDLTIRPESAATLYNRLGSKIKEYHQFGREVPHVLTTADNPKQDEVLQITTRFIEMLIPG